MASNESVAVWEETPGELGVAELAIEMSPPIEVLLA